MQKRSGKGSKCSQHGNTEVKQLFQTKAMQRNFDGFIRVIPRIEVPGISVIAECCDAYSFDSVPLTESLIFISCITFRSQEEGKIFFPAC